MIVHSVNKEEPGNKENLDASDYHLLDLQRLMLGTSPAEFLIETIFRTIIMYGFLLGVLRFLGKRMNSQATIVELSVMLMLGAIIAMPIESADRGIIPGMILLLTVLCLQRASAMFALSARTTPRVMASKITALVVDGELQLQELSKERITREQLFSLLRQRNIFNLGEIERLYFESSGGFSLFKLDEAKPGLCTYPVEEIKNMFAAKIVAEKRACLHCGAVADHNSNQPCKCSSNTWSEAVL